MNDITEAQHLDDPRLYQSQAVAIAEIHPSPTNPRKTFPEAEQAEMIESVRRHGVMQPILVRPWPSSYALPAEGTKYELIAGERRYRAAKAAGLTYISATVRELDDHETLELQIVENLHRKDLNELEEAEGYELMTKRYGYSAEQLAAKIDKSKAYIYARLKLTAAGEAARAAFRDGKLDASRLLLIARIPGAKLQEEAVLELTGWTQLANYRAAAEHVQRRYMLKLAEAPFPRGDADLVPSAGKCHPCPKRTGSNPELYPDVKSADICTDPDCYASKRSAHFARMKEEAKAQGKAVIEGKAAEKVLRNGEWSPVGFLKLDATCYEAKPASGKGYPTYREVLAEQSIPVTLIEKGDGTLMETIDEGAFKALAAEVGIKLREKSNDQDKERLAKEKAENEFRKRLFDQVHAAYAEMFTDQGDVLDAEDLRLIARQYLSCLWHEHQKCLAVLWIPSEEKIDAHERILQLTNLIDTMTAPQLSLLLVDLALIGMAHVGGYCSTDTPAPFLETAKRMRLSPDTLRRELKAEATAKAAGKGKKANDPVFKVGDYVEVIAYPTNEVLLGTFGQVKSVGRIIATSKAIYTLFLTDGKDLNAETAELGAATQAEFEAQQIERSRHQAPEAPAVVRSNRPAVAYRHPENPELEWTGRGRKPMWVEHWLAQDGNTLEQLAVPQRCDKTMELPLPEAQPLAAQA